MVITVACAFVVALTVTLISRAPAKAQAGPPTRRFEVPKANAQPQASKSPNNGKPLTLWGSFLYTNFNISASCDSEDCSAFTPMFNEEVVCPVGEGESCTFQITIESENHVGSNETTPLYGESGQYQFNVDGAAPSPGLVGMFPYICPNCYEWMYSTVYADAYIGTSAAVTATVTNTKGWQKHSVEVGIGCEEQESDSTGCHVLTTLANLQVAVYVPNQITF
jgi:hypothetical protein